MNLDEEFQIFKRREKRRIAIDEIERIRAKNNVMWCNILRALNEFAPEAVVDRIFEEIGANDRKITNLMVGDTDE